MANTPSSEIQKYEEWRGVKGLVAAKLMTDTESELTYGPVFAIAGTATVTKETESTSETHYYDDIPAIVIATSGSDTITIDTSAIPLNVLGYLTGQTYLDDKGALIEGEREPGYFAIGYITENTSNEEVYVWRYKCSIAIPGQTNSTKNDGTDANGQQLVCTGISTIHPFTANGNKPARGLVVNTALNTSVKNTFFDTVTTPDDVNGGSPAPGGTVSIEFYHKPNEELTYNKVNSATTWPAGNPYNNVLTSKTGRGNMVLVALTMGGEDISSMATVSGTSITIGIVEVTGNLYISAYSYPSAGTNGETDFEEDGPDDPTSGGSGTNDGTNGGE